MASLRELTEDEIAMIPDYRKFWYDVAFSTAQLERDRVQEAIQRIYTILGLKTPKIHFFDSLYSLVKESQNLFKETGFGEDGFVFSTRVMAQIHTLQMSFFESIGHWDVALTSKFCALDGDIFELQISEHLYQKFLKNLPDRFKEIYTFWVFPRVWYAYEASPVDFHFSAVRKQILFEVPDYESWNAYRQLIQSCSWFIAFESDCFMCERPIAFSFKIKSKLPSSIRFANGDELVLQNSNRFCENNTLTITEKDIDENLNG